MKLRTLASLLIAVILTACNNGQKSVLSSDTSSFSFNPSSNNSEPASASISSNLTTSSQAPSGPAYDGYYSKLVSWTNGEDLKNQLYTIIRTGYTAISYTKSNTANWKTNTNADHTKEDFEYLDLLYTDQDVYKDKTNVLWQREHAFCASLMCGSTTSNAVKYKGRATDFHNLIAASTNGNTSRGNKNYGYANAIDASFTDRTVNNGYDGYSYDEFTFEPGDKDKGRVARAIFYMATMYKDDEKDTVNNIDMKGLQIIEEKVDYPFVSGKPSFAIGHLSDLLEWNNSFRVDYLEMQHNISVYKDSDNLDGVAQGNRNPFVDYPGLVDYVYGNKKNQPGSLKDVVTASSYLESEQNSISHYAIKQAKREYNFGEQLTNNDYQIVAVNKNYTYQVSSNVTHSLNGHTFVESDGVTMEAKVTTPINELKYQIGLDLMATCSSGVIALTKEGINNKTPDVEQSLKYGGVDFLFSFSTTYSAVTSSGVTLTNDNQNGGFVFGSGKLTDADPKSITSLTLKTKNSYTVDKAFIKAMVNNSNSSYALTIKVGDTVAFTNTVNDSKEYKVFGGVLNVPLTGQISYIFNGYTALKLNSIAFNEII